jgi:hypothetical protein
MRTDEFVSLVKDMRQAQKTYFKTRRLDDLAASKKLEAAVDKAVQEVEDGQQSLFD